MDLEFQIHGLCDVRENFEIILNTIKRNYSTIIDYEKATGNKSYSICNYYTFNELYMSKNKADILKISAFLGNTINIKVLIAKLKKCVSYAEMMSTVESNIGISSKGMESLMKPITQKLNKFFKLTTLGIVIDNLYLDAKDLDTVDIAYLSTFETDKFKLSVDNKYVLKFVRNSIINLLLASSECKIDYGYEIDDEVDFNLVYAERKLVYYDFSQDAELPVITDTYGIQDNEVKTSNKTTIVDPLFISNNKPFIEAIKNSFDKKDVVGKDIVYVKESEYLRSGEYYQGNILLTFDTNQKTVVETVFLKKVCP